MSTYFRTIQFFLLILAGTTDLKVGNARAKHKRNCDLTVRRGYIDAFFYALFTLAEQEQQKDKR